MSNEIQTIEPITMTQLIAVEVFTGKDGVTKILSDIESELAKFVPDTSTVKGRKEIASMAYKCSQSKSILTAIVSGLIQHVTINY